MSDKKVALVTGSSRGIGKGIVKKFAQHGYQVIVHTLPSDSEHAEQTLCELREHGYDAGVVYGDISNENDVCRMFAEVREQYNHVNVLVNNAGVASIYRIEDMAVSEWERVMDINMKGTFLCSREMVKMLPQDLANSIINISSVDALKGNVFEGSTHYASSKAGIIAFTRAMAHELQGRCRVNCVAPGIVQDTGLVDEEFFKNERSKYALEAIPLGRFGTVEEVANVVYFLASERSNYVNGQCIHVNGGWIMP